jgi:hypothetical protein
VLTQVDVTNTRSGTLSLFVLDSSSGYEVRDIQGLDPVSATLTTSTIAQQDGAQPQNARRDVRSILLKVGLQPDFVSTTVQSLRSSLYDWFMPKDLVNLTFWVDETVFVTIPGQVQDFQNSMFSADPEVDITITCYDPDFTDVQPSVVTTVTGNTIPAPVSIGILDGSFESGVTGWAAGASMTLSSGTDPVSGSGTKSAHMVMGSGTMPSQTTLRPGSSGKVSVSPGKRYTLYVWVKQNVVSGTVGPAVDWSDANGVYITTSAGPSVTLVAGTYTLLTLDIPTSPVNAATATYGPTWHNPTAGAVMEADGIEFDGYIVNSNIQKIQYPGTSECGAVLAISVNRIMSTFNVYNVQPDGTLQTFSINGSFAPGDIVTLNSIPGQKALTLTRNGITTSVLYYADQANMDWPVLKKGENDFYVLASGTPVPYTLTYTPKYGAI